ncbi:hypothetical protein K456DRAFT_243435 [Colletotrichum gloeosporioides 23]|nr:hypothetical protein K456DRAFT_243435 [Colletotrichum gloeosporioides 23]
MFACSVRIQQQQSTATTTSLHRKVSQSLASSKTYYTAQSEVSSANDTGPDDQYAPICSNMLQHAALSSHPTHATDAAAPPSGPLDCMREETRSQADSTRRTWDGQRDEAYCSPAQLPLCTMDSSRPQFSLKCYLTYLNQRTKRPKGPPAKHPLLWSTGFRPTITGSSSPSKSEDEGKKKVAPLSLLPPPMRAQNVNCSTPRPQSLHYTSDTAAWLARLTGVARPVCGFSGSPPTLRCPANSSPKAPHSSRLSFHPVQRLTSTPNPVRTLQGATSAANMVFVFGQERKKEAGRLAERRKPQVCAHRRR